MNDTKSKTAWAAYLVGHGPLREPRPTELQLMRMLRYCPLLWAKEEFRGFWPEFYFYVDLNYPRSKTVSTLNCYTQTDNEELVAAQNLMLDAIFNTKSGVVQ
jgi:hypothetical protein